jgi:23S rRNA (uracil1939-C5)-methyltransferase
VTCPGCPWEGLEYAEQLEQKGEAARAALSRFPGLPAPGPVAPADPIAGYRTRAKLVVSGERVGLFAPGTHDVVDLAGCAALSPAIATAAASIRALLAKGELVAHDRGGALLAVDLREARDEDTLVMATFVVDPARAFRAPAAIEGVASVAINLRDPRSPQVLGQETRGGARLRDRLGPGAPWVLAAPGSFVQAHRGTATAIHDAIAEEIAPGARVVELHAGSGALALRLARDGARVLAVDAFAPGIERARRAAEEQGIGGVEFLAGDASAALDREVDVVVLDPPRRGVPAELRAAIAGAAARAIYVSCDPDTLARDLAHLQRLGLAAREIRLFDMMPGTPHVEALAILERSPPPPPRVLFEDERLVAVDKPPHEPTTPQSEHATSLLARVRAMPHLEGAVPVHRLDAGTSGVCLFARAPGHVEALARALAEGKKRYVALVRGIAHGKGIVRRALRDEGRSLAATTRWQRRRIVGGHSLVRAAPAEGRLHQIRRHLASIGHPVLGDERYGHAPSNRHLWERAALDRPFLHSERIELAGGPTIESPLAPDLELVLERLERSAR